MTDTINRPDLITATVLLGDADAESRLRAAVDLGTWRAAEAAPALVARLGVEPSHAIRETLTWALLRVADARPLLLDALGDPNWLTRMQACHVLSKLGDAGDAGDAAVLLPVIADPVDAVASRAWWAAGQTGSPLVVEALADQLGRGDSELRNSLTIAFEALGGLGVPALARRLRRGASAAIREHAADTLGLLGSPDADPVVLTLREALDDPDPMVGFAALNALGQLDSPRAREAVRAALDATDPRLQRLAARLVRRHRPGPPGEAVPAEGRELADALVAAAPGVLVGLACESAVLAESRALRALGDRIAELAASHPGLDIAGLAASELPDGISVAAALDELSAASGEAVVIASVERLDGPSSHQLHLVDGVPRVGVLIGHTGEPGPETDRILARLALQVALGRPRHVAVADVPRQEWDEVRAASLSRARADGLPGTLDERVIAGAAADHATRHVLLEQVSITDPGVTIDGLLYGRGIRVTGFRRLERGPIEALSVAGRP
ncbi:MAG: HEAT repeat domain-containing protein [Micropruina sp.]|uniref:HEAT repeat domain-containing protein n=1 Tax=Micropruina sp. TaxID=2737536 RepID=UPI0039E56AD3